jgi:hypothetical protein
MYCTPITEDEISNLRCLARTGVIARLFRESTRADLLKDLDLIILDILLGVSVFIVLLIWMAATSYWYVPYLLLISALCLSIPRYRELASLATIKRHPLTTALSSYGPVSKVAEEIMRSFSEEILPKAHAFYLSTSWVCYAGARPVVIIRIDDIVWVYYEEIKHQDVRRTQLVIWSTDALAYLFVLPEVNIKQIITALCQIAPWANYGYNDGLVQSWNLDNDIFIEAVVARRNALRSQAATT